MLRMDTWAGFYVDGRTAARRAARVRLMQQGLEVELEGGESRFWRYAELRQTQGFYRGEEVRLERGEAGEALLVPDVGFLTALRDRAPEEGRRFHDPRRRARRLQLTVLAGLAVIAVIAGLYLWGVPALARAAAARVPVAWEAELGAAVLDQLAPPARRCDDPVLAEALGAIVERLRAPVRDTPYAFRVIVLDDPGVNAFALPGGSIVVLRGLLERTRRPEELAGVLAHEMQHVIQRHATRALIQQASTGLLLTALSGDATGSMVYALQAARVLGTLRYSRQAEAEADGEGMRLLLEARVDPAGMVAMFQAIAEQEGPAGRHVPDFLQTHPSPPDRLERLRALSAEAPGPARPLLPGRDWGAIARRCRLTPP
ncbi:MAG: M48 family metallopeptidase [Candidatus Rokubacteria bacterium]|nr:M48 family metallopeptidase [Candidatus Rokubacteria bacterium]